MRGKLKITCTIIISQFILFIVSVEYNFPYIVCNFIQIEKHFRRISYRSLLLCLPSILVSSDKFTIFTGYLQELPFSITRITICTVFLNIMQIFVSLCALLHNACRCGWARWFFPYWVSLIWVCGWWWRWGWWRGWQWWP